MNVEHLRVEDLEDALPTLQDGECWQFYSEYVERSFFSNDEVLRIWVGIVSDDGYAPRSWWDALRGKPKVSRDRIWCHAEVRLKPAEVNVARAKTETLNLVDKVYQVRQGQLTIEDFNGKVCQ